MRLRPEKEKKKNWVRAKKRHNFRGPYQVLASYFKTHVCVKKAS
jgi:hypothetical protein